MKTTLRQWFWIVLFAIDVVWMGLILAWLHNK